MRVPKHLFVTILVLTFAVLASGQASDSPTITFVNQSGENCLVKLVGPTTGYLNVPNGTQQTINVRGGHYHILTRYGDTGHFRYTRGEPFEVSETAYSVSDISITLHKVVGGNYTTNPDSGSSF